MSREWPYSEPDGHILPAAEPALTVTLSQCMAGRVYPGWLGGVQYRVVQGPVYEGQDPVYETQGHETGPVQWSQIINNIVLVQFRRKGVILGKRVKTGNLVVF